MKLNSEKLAHRLLVYLSDGVFHSGEELADKLGVSRTTVWKLVAELKQQFGLAVSAVSGKGYRLTHSLDLLVPAKIESALTQISPEKINLSYFSSIGSTNSYLFQELEPQTKVVQPRLCIAETQSSGRGRQGRNWFSPFAANLYFSLSWHYSAGAQQLAGLSLAVAVAILRFLDSLGLYQAQVKWPNDILLDGKKLAGILIELKGDIHGPCAVVIGIGLNVRMSMHQPDKTIDRPWIDLASSLEASCPTRTVLLNTLLKELIPIVRQYDKEGLSSCIEEWRRRDAYLDQSVELFAGEHKLRGVVRGINDEGLLLLEQEGRIVTYASGEISFSSK